MSVFVSYCLVQTLKAVAFAGVCVIVYGMVVFIRKARAQNRRPVVGAEEEEFINIALCETRFGICTHYHDIGVEPLNYGGYPIKGYPTLCGAEAGWDMQNQDVEATCQTCQEALAKMAREEKK